MSFIGITYLIRIMIFFQLTRSICEGLWAVTQITIEIFRFLNRSIVIFSKTEQINN